MNKQLGIFLAGVIIVVPVVATAYAVWWVGIQLDAVGASLLGRMNVPYIPGVGAVVVLAGIYLIGLLARFLLFRKALGLFERIVARVPGVKTIYESIRDLMGLFGRDSHRMGRVVEYRPPGSAAALLAILTNDQPPGIIQEAAEPKVAIYLPFSYMFGGITIFVEPQHLREMDMSVEMALKLAATAVVIGKPEVSAAEELSTSREADSPTEEHS